MKKYKNERGFTLIEMLIVLVIITALILLIVPGLTKQSKAIHDNSCDALVKAVQAQVFAFQLEEGKNPASLQELVAAELLSSENLTCKNGKELTYDADSGKVS